MEDIKRISKQWDVETLLLKIHSTLWGIAPELFSIAQEILKEVIDGYERKENMDFREFKALVEFLYKRGVDSNDINTALKRYSENNVNRNTDRDVQLALNSLFSTEKGGNFRVFADGIWGPQSQRTLEYIARRYNLPVHQRDTNLVEILKSIASRLVRVKCTNKQFIEVFPDNPFYLLENQDFDFELIAEGNGASLRKSEGTTTLVHFHSFLARDGRGANAFNQFFAWLMLLQTTSKKHQKVWTFRIENSEKEFIRMSDLKSDYNDAFIIKPDYYMDVDSLNANLRLLYSTEESIKVICAFFSGNFRFRLTVGEYFVAPKETSMDSSVVFDSASLYAEYDDYYNADSLATAKCRGDYLKIFVVKDSLWRNINDLKVIPFPGVDADAMFYGLITSNLNDVYADYTIGLNFKRTELSKPKQFNNKWVLVVGSASFNYDDSVGSISTAIGEALAINGYGIVTGNWQGVDEAVSKAFSGILQSNDISPKERLKQLVDKSEKDTYAYGQVQVVNQKGWHVDAVKNIGAIILIGGGKGTYKVFQEAGRKSVPVIPIRAARGTSEDVFINLHKRQASPISADLFKGLGDEVSGPGDAKKVAKTVKSILDSLQFPDYPLLSNEEFKSIVERVYKSRKIVVLDDLQKNRWGGKSSSNGKTISATVEKKLLPGIYDIEILVNTGRADEKVAFFLHDSFSKEIVYRTAKNGVAILKDTAYEAFCVGAYTEDGTMLELDLQLQTGYPSGFYYKDISDGFREKIEKLYKAQKVLVKDDLQKNRWGGKSTVRGKQIKVSVSNSLIGYKVNIEVSATDSENPLSGDVAFFLHDSFPKQIKYRKAINGIAKISMTAYEAFTIGAYTEDDTALEIDLQRQTGYPKGFYYRETERTQEKVDPKIDVKKKKPVTDKKKKTAAPPKTAPAKKIAKKK